MYTFEEFKKILEKDAQEMSNNLELNEKSRELLAKAHDYHWIHQSKWFGQPSLQLPQDMFAIQEIIYLTKPKYIIEIGVCWGGTTLFMSSILKMLNLEDSFIIGIDKYIPNDLVERISAIIQNEKLPKIELINCDTSISDDTFNKVLKIISKESAISKDCLIILDSYHTHEHVLKELNRFSPLLNKGNYIIVCDTWLEGLKNPKEKRPWGPGNSPKTAVNEFLSLNPFFKKDYYIKNKLLLSCSADGYLYKDE